MEENFGFCTRCGATREPGAQFCPQCGKSFLDESDEVRFRQGPNPIRFFIILLGLFAVISLGEGIYSTAFNDSLIANIKALHPNNMAEYLAGLGLDTVEQLADILFKQGVLTVADGVLVAIVLVLCLKLRYWKVAVMLCLIASALVLASLAFMTPQMMRTEAFSIAIQTIIGLLIARGIYINRRVFR